jgi:hypothetical protein
VIVARLSGGTSPETIREQALKELGLAQQSPSSDRPQSGTREREDDGPGGGHEAGCLGAEVVAGLDGHRLRFATSKEFPAQSM